MRTRWLAAGGAGALLVLGIAAWALPSARGPRPATLDEATRMALARYTTFEASPVRVRIQAPMAGATVVIDAVVDYREHHAVGSYRASGTPAGLVAWDDQGLGVAPGRPGDPLVAAASMPGTGWSPRRFTSDPFDAVLHLTMELGQNRPDNAQVLAEQGPRWLRSERIGGAPYDVFAGPRPRSAKGGGASPLTYWINGDGRLGRVTMRLAGVAAPLTVDFTGGPAGPVPAAPWGAG